MPKTRREFSPEIKQEAVALLESKRFPDPLLPSMIEACN